MEAGFSEQSNNICSQVFMIGYLDGRCGITRSKQELVDILENICNKYEFKRGTEMFDIISVHYENGGKRYKEQVEMYHSRTCNYNPNNELLYHRFLEMPCLDEDVKKIVESYPDFDYEMRIYNNQMNQQVENRQK